MNRKRPPKGSYCEGYCAIFDIVAKFNAFVGREHCFHEARAMLSWG